MTTATKMNDKKCYFCGKLVDDETYCYGCEHYICEDCSLTDDADPCGNHQVTDHNIVRRY